jgi:two-component sensor histidine kinase/PAS domain-containing protein
MSVLSDLLRDRSDLRSAAVDHLQLLLGDWQVVADLSFADLLLWVPCTAPDGRPAYLCAGQMRPYTAQTIYIDDQVGQVFPVTSRPMIGRALVEGRVIRDADPDWSTGVPVREEAIPVRFSGEIIAAVTREANVSTARSPSQLELTYLQSAGELAQMLAEGTFPHPGGVHEEREHSPRVGDGIMRIDDDGTVAYASPNAISAFRRLGTLDGIIGQHLKEFDPSPKRFLEALDEGFPVDSEIERQGAVIVRRFIPLRRGDEVTGALLLVRDVTELRRHERELRVKDATIREIHHRVKNNLQTVASLLRLQGRRLHSEEARDALAESVRRISSIALVHETLSQESRELVHFLGIAERILAMLGDGLLAPETRVTFDLEDDPGELPAEVATPLALVLTELLQNSVEHAWPRESGGSEDGRVVVKFDRQPNSLRVVVADNGVGLPDDAALDGIANLGLQIARTLVESELGGAFDAYNDNGASFELILPLP